jgi:hypothetical protein
VGDSKSTAAYFKITFVLQNYCWDNPVDVKVEKLSLEKLQVSFFSNE